MNNTLACLVFALCFAPACQDEPEPEPEPESGDEQSESTEATSSGETETSTEASETETETETGANAALEMVVMQCEAWCAMGAECGFPDDGGECLAYCEELAADVDIDEICLQRLVDLFACFEALSCEEIPGPDAPDDAMHPCAAEIEQVCPEP